MKRLTLLASVLLTISATSVQAQSVICEKFGAGQIIANRVCPLGYVKKGEVAETNGGGFGSAGMRAAQDMINRNEADRQARLARQAAAAEAQRQREHEERMLRLRTQQSRSTPPTRSSGSSGQPRLPDSKNIWEIWKLTSRDDFTGLLTISTSCTASLRMGVTKYEVDRIIKTGSEIRISSNDGGDDRGDSVLVSAQLTSSFTFSGKAKLQGQEYELTGSRTRREGKTNAFCLPPPSNSQQASSNTGDGQETLTPINLKSDNQERGKTLIEDLEALGKLHTDGILTDEEFNAAKRRLLGL
ncbi:SHOCT domain-containing protein [Gammaproteobacteria bacterium]|nr:SHOCT domain-containing protein [Gammaproteobacteria bacterium]